jgi:hypothetical protein
LSARAPGALRLGRAQLIGRAQDRGGQEVERLVELGSRVRSAVVRRFERTRG